MEFTTLLSPIKIGNLEIKNRFVVPPMGTNYANPDGTVSRQMIDYYVERAKGGFGLIILEVTAVDPLGKAILFEAGLWDDSQIPGFKQLVDEVHAAGAKIFMQLHHCGRQTVPFYLGGEQPVAPSAVACPVMDAIPHELTNEEVWDLVEKFGDAAVRAKKAGFDGVEVHGAHGYLVAQFMSPHANKRMDEFGGTFMGRMKFPLEIFKNIRSKVGNDYPMSFRFGYDEMVNGGRTIEESTVIARLAEEAGVDVLNVSIMTYASMPYMSAPPAMPSGFNQYPTAKIKASVSIPVITVGRYNNMYMAEDVLKSGRADLIALGRESITDPFIPTKVAENRLEDIAPCIGCVQSCLGYLLNPAVNKISCLVNPRTGHEGEYDFSKVEKGKKVLVVGGGPGGMLAAYVAAMRGHDVSLYEKEEHLGGQFRLAGVPPTKHELLGALQYYKHMGDKYGVKYHLNTEVDAETVKELAPDAVVLATGSQPCLPNIPGIDNPKFVSCLDILGAKVQPGAKVLVVGGGMSGAETADFLGEHNRQVSIVEMREAIAADEQPTVRFFLMKRLEEHKTQMHTSAKVTRFFDDGVEVEENGETKTLRGFDTIVLATGVKAYNPLQEKLEGICKEVYVIGDAEDTGPANKATEAGMAVGLAI